MITAERLRELADALVTVPGVRGVMLGGSRARGDHAPDSDHDLGLYYEPPLDVAALGGLAREVAGPEAAVTEPGAWGPWVDGGGWLTVDGSPVDWIYRDLGRVRAAWTDAQAGRFGFHTQVGHPLGVPDFSYVAEVALGVVLADPDGVLTGLQAEVVHYPPRLADAVVGLTWEAGFLVDGARKAASRGDSTFVAGCLFRAVGLCAHALHGRAGRWLTHEKGAVASAGRLDVAPPGWASRAHGLLGAVGTTPDELEATVEVAERLVADVVAVC